MIREVKKDSSEGEFQFYSFDTLPDAALLTIRDISRLAGRSRTSLWRDVRDGRLPSPSRIGPNAVRWRVSDVRAYLNGGKEPLGGYKAI
jgi:predicted DNA-binding transcriptional regulator AlpA